MKMFKAFVFICHFLNLYEKQEKNGKKPYFVTHFLPVSQFTFEWL